MPHRIDSVTNDMRGVEEWQLDNGKRIKIAVEAIKLAGGALNVLFRAGLCDDPAKLTRKPLYDRQGRQIGTVPGHFDPTRVRSTGWMYDPRSGDFIQHEDGFRIAAMLGPGDVAMIEGFIYDR